MGVCPAAAAKPTPKSQLIAVGGTLSVAANQPHRVYTGSYFCTVGL